MMGQKERSYLEMVQQEGKAMTVLCFAFTVLVCIVLVTGMFCIRWAVESYIAATGRPESIIGDLVRAYYFCAPPALAGLLLLCQLLSNILKGRIFERVNAFLLRGIGCCAFLATVLCVALGFRYLPLLFCAAAGLFLSLILAVLSRLFDAAARIKAENELTI